MKTLFDMRVESEVYKLNDSFANGTNDREAYPKRWVAALVQMNCEKKVAAKLDKMGITNYVPVQQEEHQWSDRKKKIGRVVIPMIVFVRGIIDDDIVDIYDPNPEIIEFESENIVSDIDDFEVVYGPPPGIIDHDF